MKPGKAKYRIGRLPVLALTLLAYLVTIRFAGCVVSSPLPDLAKLAVVFGCWGALPHVLVWIGDKMAGFLGEMKTRKKFVNKKTWKKSKAETAGQ